MTEQEGQVYDHEPLLTKSLRTWKDQLGMVAPVVMSAPGRQMQEDYSRFETSLVYIMSSGLARATLRDPVPKKRMKRRRKRKGRGGEQAREERGGDMARLVSQKFNNTDVKQRVLKFIFLMTFSF